MPVDASTAANMARMASLSAASASLQPRHIQDMTMAKQLEKHWGYADRALPCTNDKGSCEYLDEHYGNHDLSMIYTGVMCLVVVGFFLSWSLLRMVKPRSGSKRTADGEGSKATIGFGGRVAGVIESFRYKHLLPESMTGFFGNVSRLQVSILAIICIYLIIFSFICGVYKTWVTPIKNTTSHNTRTGIGAFGNRVGIFAYALTPLAIMLCSRDSFLSLLTGVSYQHFMFLHRWLGRIIYAQSTIHTIAWTIVEAKLYQPQPKAYREFIEQLYIIWGVIAMLFVTILFVFSFRSVIKITGYEVFRKLHYVAAMIYIGACWGHWDRLKCFMIPSLALWLLDRSLRAGRMLLVHVGKSHLDPVAKFGFHPAQAHMQLFTDQEGAVVRLDFEHAHSAWTVGQHFFLTFPDLSIWQSHPMTVASVPTPGSKVQKHTYIIRALKGETGKLAQLAAGAIRPKNERSTDPSGAVTSTPVILTGAHGSRILRKPAAHVPVNALFVAGGTGVSFTYPLAIAALEQAVQTGAGAGSIEFVWVIRRVSDVAWMESEMTELRSRLGVAKSSGVEFRMRIFVTRDERPGTAAHDSGSETASEKHAHHGVTMTEEEVLSKELAVDGKMSATIVAASKPAFERSISSFLTPHSHLSVHYLRNHHPDFSSRGGEGMNVVDEWLRNAAGNGGHYDVYASGPGNLGRDLRVAVARENEPGRVWRGDTSGNVSFYWDDRYA